MTAKIREVMSVSASKLDVISSNLAALSVHGDDCELLSELRGELEQVEAVVFRLRAQLVMTEQEQEPRPEMRINA